MDAALLSADAIEREISANAKLSARDKELINKWREKDRVRKKAKRAASGGRNIAPLSSSNNIDSLSNRKEESAKTIRRTSTGQGRPLKGVPLPADWAPSAGHYAEADRAGLSAADVDTAATAMRNWTVAEGHRARARKADVNGWNACFSGTWLGKVIEQRKRGGSNKGQSFMDIAARGG